MQKEEVTIEQIFEGLLISEDYSRKLACECFFRMNPTLVPLWGFEDVIEAESLGSEQSYCALLKFD